MRAGTRRACGKPTRPAPASTPVKNAPVRSGTSRGATCYLHLRDWNGPAAQAELWLHREMSSHSTPSQARLAPGHFLYSAASCRPPSPPNFCTCDFASLSRACVQLASEQSLCCSPMALLVPRLVFLNLSMRLLLSSPSFFFRHLSTFLVCCCFRFASLPPTPVRGRALFFVPVLFIWPSRAFAWLWVWSS